MLHVERGVKGKKKQERGGKKKRYVNNATIYLRN
jgi:hypothetical protein